MSLKNDITTPFFTPCIDLPELRTTQDLPKLRELAVAATCSKDAVVAVPRQENYR